MSLTGSAFVSDSDNTSILRRELRDGQRVAEDPGDVANCPMEAAGLGSTSETVSPLSSAVCGHSIAELYLICTQAEKAAITISY